MGSIRDYFKPTGEVRGRDIAREFLMQGGFKPGFAETAKALPRDMARFGLSAMEAPAALRSGEASGKFYDTPLGRINSFQSEAQNRVQRGDPMWKAMGNPMLDTVLAGSDMGSLAGLGAKSMRPMSSLARDMTNNLGTPFESSFMQGVSRPGMTTYSTHDAIDPSVFKYNFARGQKELGPGLRPTLNQTPFQQAIGKGEPFRPSRGLSLDEMDELEGSMMTADPKLNAIVPRWSPETVKPNSPMGDGERSLSYMDLRSMQQENPEAALSAAMNHRKIAEAPGFGVKNAGQAIVPGGRPSILPDFVRPEKTETAMKNLFQGGINTGDYNQRNPVHVLDSVGGQSRGERTGKRIYSGQDSIYSSPDMGQIAAAVSERSPVILEMPNEDVGTGSTITEGVRSFLESHNYRETAPGVWQPGKEDLSSWLFKHDGSKKISGAVTPKESSSLRPELSESELRSMVDSGEEKSPFNILELGDTSLYTRNGRTRPNVQFDMNNLLPESYGQDITDDFSRSWHGGSPSFYAGKGKEFYKDTRADIAEGKVDKWGTKLKPKALAPKRFSNQDYLDDIEKLAKKYGNDPKYQAEKGDDRFYARIADDHFNELDEQTRRWLEFEAPAMDFESPDIPSYKGFANADPNSSGTTNVHGGQITALRDAVDFDRQTEQWIANLKKPKR